MLALALALAPRLRLRSVAGRVPPEGPGLADSPPMSERRWFNPNQPQTLQIAVMLLYLRAAFAILLGGFDPVTLVIGGAMAFGAWGIANEMRAGYYVAVGAAVLPFVQRFLLYGTQGLFFEDPLSLMIDLALIALLVHPMSSEYQKVWFK